LTDGILLPFVSQTLSETVKTKKKCMMELVAWILNTSTGNMREVCFLYKTFNNPYQPDVCERKNAMLKKKCDTNIARTIELAKKMIKLAQSGYEEREDPNCGVLYGILLDSGYRLLDLAQKEKEAHMQKGWWGNSIREEKN